MMKKLLATLLTVVLLLSFATVAFAADDLEATIAAADLQAQGRALITGTIDVFATGTFYLRGHTSLPEGALEFDMAHEGIAIVMAANDGNVVLEQQVDWASMIGGFRGWVFRALLGRTMRMIITDDDVRVVFPNRRLFFSMAELHDLLGGDMPIFDLAELDFTSFAQLDIPADLLVERAGNDIRVTLENTDEGYTHFYYRTGLLRRIVTELPDNSISVIEVGTFSGNAPANLFSTSWMLRMPLGWLIRIINPNA